MNEALVVDTLYPLKQLSANLQNSADIKPLVLCQNVLKALAKQLHHNYLLLLFADNLLAGEVNLREADRILEFLHHVRLVIEAFAYILSVDLRGEFPAGFLLDHLIYIAEGAIA